MVSSANTKCQAIIQHHSKSFSLASKLLPRRVRKDALVLYAWCRFCDDAVDQVRSHESARDAVVRLRDELELVYSDNATSDPVLAAFQDVITRCNIPRQYPSDLLEGMTMDVEGFSYVNEDDLLLYCYRVAGTVGLMMCHVLGVSDDQALPHAMQLGMAMQLTNIARDVVEDWHRGRCYIPASWLGLDKITSLAQINKSDAMHRLLSIADEFYQKGAAGFRYLSRDCVLAIDVAKNVYAQIGEKIKANGYRVSDQRTYVSRWEKLWIGGLTMIKHLFAPPSRLSTVRLPNSVWKYNVPDPHSQILAGV
ncbi:MAG: phytoene/squalene synthase family protein [Gemmataceae bacterium]